MLMLAGVICFEGIPGAMIRLFTKEPETIALGIPAFRIIALSFLSAVLSLIYPVVFQAVAGTVRYHWETKAWKET